MAKSKEVAVLDKHEVTPFGKTPSYLPTNVNTNTGMEELGKDDFKTPRIKLLQPLNPEIRSFQGKAIPGQFWHTGMNVDLTNKFRFVPIIAGKRVILWNPRDSGEGGILAFSRDAKTWQSGADKIFKVKINKGTKEVSWNTKKNVQQSGLTDWGSSDPDDSNSSPAAQLSYEYLVYLIDYSELSPCVLGTFRTSIPNAKQFNTALLGIVKMGKPIQAVAVNCFAEETHEGKNIWHVPRFELAGWAPEGLYKITSELAERYANYTVDYDNEDVTTKPNGDEIPF